MAQTPHPSEHHPPVRAGAAQLFSKHGMVVSSLARELLAYAAGERIERVQAYAARFEASVGTVQAALAHLESIGAATFEARGRRGTYAVRLDHPLLWALALQRPIVGALPLPYSRRFAGLATGLREQFVRSPVDLDLRFMRGAVQRLQALAARQCDWALVSRFAAETAAAHGFSVQTLMSLGHGTYMAPHVLLLRAPVTRLRTGMRVGVDSASTDHLAVVRLACRGVSVEFVSIEYSEGLKLVLSGAIDATVWSEEDLPPGVDDLRALPLDAQLAEELAPLRDAAIVVQRGDRPSAAVLESVLDVAQLRHVQEHVVRLERRPSY